MSDGIDFPLRPAAPALQRLDVRAFDPIEGAWKSVTDDESAVDVSAVTFVTFNTWFQGEARELRYGGLLEVLRDSDADVVFLQEATEPLLEVLSDAGWVRDRYRIVRSPFRADAIPSHGTLLLSKLPLRQAALHSIPTHMGRHLLTAETSIHGRRLVLATAHLDSMKSHADTRGEQLRSIFARLEPSRDVLFAGDFNFCSSSVEENSRLDPRYVDIWPALRPHEPGFTQDTDINTMLARAKRESRRVRIDRMLLRSDDARWKAESIRLLGTRPVSDTHRRIFPSDHFGLWAMIRGVHAAPEAR